MGWTANLLVLVLVFLVCKPGQKERLGVSWASDPSQPFLCASFDPRELHCQGSFTSWPLLGMANGRPGGKMEGGREGRIEGNSSVLYSPSLLFASQ